MKRKLFLSFLTLELLSLFGACSNEDIPDAPRLDDSIQVTNPGLDRALQIVEEMMKELDGGATRSSRRIATIEQVNQLTRSDVQDPNWFLVNYDDEAGFALVNDAKIYCPVYGIANTGSLSMTDTTENKGLAIVLEYRTNGIMKFLDYLLESYIKI
ncbi:MAG: hypothetical protein HDS26_01400 [Bacteroides sp.]|nr:hypothetical protein [Bacteroides sp.]